MAAARGPVTTAVVNAMTGQGEWPENVLIFQPNKDTILLSDAAYCRSVEAFLRFCKLDYELKCRNNAEHMSPTGNVPFMKMGSELIVDFNAITTYVQAKGLSTSKDLTPTENADMKAYMSLIEESLVPAELHLLWCQKESVQRTRCQYGSPYPAPLNVLLSYAKQWSAYGKLKAIGWHCKTSDEVTGEVKRVCQALSVKLGKNRYFITDRPTELDAVVFGHLHSLMTRYIPDECVVDVIRAHRNLEEFVMRILKEYF